MIRKRGFINRIINSLLIYWLAQFFYILGLTLLIPTLLLLLLPSEDVAIGSGISISVLITSLVLILVSFIMLFLERKRISETLKIMGWTTIIPGVIGIIVGVFGQDAIFALFQKYIFAFDTLEPVIRLYLASAVPKMLILTILYVVIGILLWILGEKIRNITRNWL